MVFINWRNIKWYWWNFKSEFLGGYEKVKEMFSEMNIIEDIKATYKRLKEDDEYEAMQKRYIKKEILQAGDIITFHNPEVYGDEITAQVLCSHYDFFSGFVFVHLKVISSGLFEKDCLLPNVPQYRIMNNIINYGGNINE